MTEGLVHLTARVPAALMQRLNGSVPGRGRSQFVIEAIEKRLDVLEGKAGGMPADARQEAVMAAIRKRGRTTPAQIALDTGFTDTLVESVLRKLGGRVRWPDPGVVAEAA